jgi:hypothetical protein
MRPQPAVAGELLDGGVDYVVERVEPAPTMSFGHAWARQT